MFIGTMFIPFENPIDYEQIIRDNISWFQSSYYACCGWENFRTMFKWLVHERHGTWYMNEDRLADTWDEMFGKKSNLAMITILDRTPVEDNVHVFAKLLEAATPDQYK